jgi:sugar phosphate isomerase/epimerase
MTCYFSTGCFQTKNLDEIISLSLEHGFDLELSSAVSCSSTTLDYLYGTRAKMRFLVHNYFPPPANPFVLNLASASPDIHRESVNHCINAIDLCSKLGAPFYSVHAGYALNLNPEELGNPQRQSHLAKESRIPRNKAYETFVTTLRGLASYATEKNVGLLVENNVLASENLADDGSYPMLLADVTEIMRFFSDVNSSSVGLLLDTGHAKVSAVTLGTTPDSYLDELSPFIRCLHLSDNDGIQDSNCHFTQKSWFAPFLKRVGEVPKVIEVYRLSMNEMLAQRQVLADLST